MKTAEDVINEPLWFNSHFRTSNLSILHWAKHGLLSIRDISNDHGLVLKFQVKTKFGIARTFTDYEKVL